jgi:hypothetical protein
MHLCTSRKCGYAESLSVPQSVSQSACVIIILIRIRNLIRNEIGLNKFRKITIKIGAAKIRTHDLWVWPKDLLRPKNLGTFTSFSSYLMKGQIR